MPFSLCIANVVWLCARVQLYRARVYTPVAHEPGVPLGDGSAYSVSRAAAPSTPLDDAPTVDAGPRRLRARGQTKTVRSIAAQL